MIRAVLVIHLRLNQPVYLDENKTYNLTLEVPITETFETFQSNIELLIESDQAEPVYETLPDNVIIEPDYPFTTWYVPSSNGNLTEIVFKNITGINPDQIPPLAISLWQLTDEQAFVESELIKVEPAEPDTLRYQLSQPIPVDNLSEYQMRLNPPSQEGSLSLEADTVLNEGDWDDGLPIRMDGYDPFGGIYPPDVNLNIVYEDTPEKLERVINYLDTSDYIVISSNRQYGTMTRMPERFPMTDAYYRNLIGCPAEKDIIWCYRVAKPGTFLGNLGFELVKTFQSDPSIGP